MKSQEYTIEKEVERKPENHLIIPAFGIKLNGFLVHG